MPEAVPLGNGCYLRPAHQPEWQQIQKLLRCLRAELNPQQSNRFWHYVGVALLTAIGIRLIEQTGLQGLLLALSGLLLIQGSIWFSHSTSEEWRKFWVVEHQGRLIACAKLWHYDNCMALYDVVVLPQWRGKGIGSAMIQHLSDRTALPLYLACHPERISFYTRLGFQTVSPIHLTPILRYDLGLTTRPELVPLKRG